METNSIRAIGMSPQSLQPGQDTRASKDALRFTTFDEARTWLASQRFSNRDQFRSHMDTLHDRLDSSSRKLLEQAFTQHSSAPKTMTPGRLPPQQLYSGLKNWQSVLMHGLCASSSNREEQISGGVGTGWSALRVADFDQIGELEEHEPEHPGACVIYSALWLNDVNSRDGSAGNRMHRLADRTPEVIDLQRDYENRFHANEAEDPMHETVRRLGIIPNAASADSVDVITDEGEAMQRLSESLFDRGSKLILFGRDMSHSASGHVIAAHSDGSRVKLFDPNLGEFRMKRSDIPTVMRAIIATNSQSFPVPTVEVLPVIVR
ncbi:hypothetical protein JMY81_14880 [Brenneria goodwinii]|uniref:Peptidase C58 YopT-type domain-containing protein n=1 Tax=Brenneria goodwinii TaxID=1109412 RepID=A0A0G4JRC8_9GAMM|nr:YopT-type cysteine protease domain-containing protein [Brenneria goodwinii]MCG8156527.1 hypothetical protein [Brenneria goodwinii]MCG8162102.1 hypothetical protein [Brenneria goodwinii]MCG8166856.1 hypothetical protein [Brenneria goodwinii]MCG8171506.1 hypothetical protein [Brenneria goodwinii]MCG8175071.1 hypothetical protein [Brenneria goodwinii]